VNLPHVAVALEERAHPDLAGRPFAVESDQPGPRVVYDLSLAAHRMGVRRGMKLSQARKVCPEIAIRPPTPELYAQTFRTLVGVLTDFTPTVEPADLEKSWVSTAELAARESTERSLAREVESRVRRDLELEPRLGLAQGKMTSRIVTQVLEGGFMVLPRGRDVSFLAGLTVAHLPLETPILERILSLGLTKIHQYGALPSAGILPRFGYQGLRAYFLAHGQDDSRVQPFRQAPSFEAAHVFEEPVSDLEMLRKLLVHLAERVALPLSAAFQMAQSLTIMVNLENGARIVRSRSMDEPAVSARILANHAAALISREQWSSAGIDRVSLSVQGLCPTLGQQLDLFRREHARREGIERTLRTVQAKFGNEVVRKGQLLEPASVLPERRAYAAPWAA
jgi:DNA polymerase-4